MATVCRMSQFAGSLNNLIMDKWSDDDDDENRQPEKVGVSCKVVVVFSKFVNNTDSMNNLFCNLAAY